MAESKIDMNLSIETVSGASASITVMRSAVIRSGNVAIIYTAFRANADIGGDTALFAVPNAYQANAPLDIFCPDDTPANKNSNCRVASGYVRAGISVISGKEYVVMGIYATS